MRLVTHWHLRVEGRATAAGGSAVGVSPVPVGPLAWAARPRPTRRRLVGRYTMGNILKCKCRRLSRG